MSRCSSCFSCAILWTVTPLSYSNRTVPSVVQLPFTLTFFLPSFSQNIQSGLILFCQDQETYGVYFQNHYCLQWWRCWQATQVHCELLVAIPVITQSLRKSRRDLNTDIRHPKMCFQDVAALCLTVFQNNQPNMIPNFHCSILRCVLYRLHNPPPVVLFSLFLNSFYFNMKLIWY